MHTKINRYKNIEKRRAVRTRGKIAGSLRPRLAVFRSNKYIFVQIIDVLGKSWFGTRGKNPTEVGEIIAKKAKENKMTQVVFDRGSYRYHGQVKALAEAARKAGMEF